MAKENLVVVESPAKAKTIEKYLGPAYKVIASFGHVRDLREKDGSVLPEQDFEMVWELTDRGRRTMKDIASSLKPANKLILATDPDREGESISWHVTEVLDDWKALKGKAVERVTFNEITRTAVTNAIAHPRQLDHELIDAYRARRALDYLVGYTLSPLLWRKLPGSKSAGRVQSVALRLICEREAEIEAFRSREYWTIEATFKTAGGGEFKARLTHLDGRKLDRFDLGDESSAKAALERIAGRRFVVSSVESRQIRRNPWPPFTTSTLQQEASRKLGFGASKTMRVAQQLYEGVDIGGETVGLITYMRTDGTQLSQEAIAQARRLIASEFGDAYVPKSPRAYKTAAKNAQEAHEAIRPTDLSRRPGAVAQHLDRDQQRLYELVWRRTIACQMESAVLDQATIDVDADGAIARFRAVGTVIRFDGFLKVYEEDRDDPADAEDETSRRLPLVKQGEGVERIQRSDEAAQHFTQPPPRFSEASLVKRLEELGIGRPSTYASILQVLQDREYVRLEKRRFVPEDRGRLVTAFLVAFFERYVGYDFTADLENNLDEITGGQVDWRKVLRDFWGPFTASVEGTQDLTISQVIETLDAALGEHFFPPREGEGDPRLCPSCAAGRLGLRLSRSGAFIGCSNYPSCRYTRPLAVPSEEAEGENGLPRHLGTDPATGLPVTVRKGPYGVYAQLGPAEGVVETPPADVDAAPAKAKKGRKVLKSATADKPKRASLPKGIEPTAITLEQALKLLAMPYEVCPHPETGEPILIGVGRFGPYVKYRSTFVSIPAGEDVLSIGANRAIDLVASAGQKRSAEPLKDLGPHPADGAPIQIFAGRYGPYVRHGGIMASLSKASSPESLTVDEAIALLAKKASAGKPAKAARGPSAKGRSATKAAAPAKSAKGRAPSTSKRAGKAASARGG